MYKEIPENSVEREMQRCGGEVSCGSSAQVT